MKNGNDKKSVPAQLAVSIKLEASADTPVHYVNYMAVSHLPFDFTISAVRVPSELSPDQTERAKKGQPVRLESTLQIVIPPAVAKGLIQALTTQVKEYETQYGKIHGTPPTPEKKKDE